MTHAGNNKYLAHFIKRAILETTTWRGRDFCRAERNPIPVTAEILFNDNVVGAFSASINPGDYFIMSDVALTEVAKPPNSNFGTAFVKALSPRGMPYDPTGGRGQFSNTDALKALHAMIPQASGPEAATALYTIGHLLRRVKDRTKTDDGRPLYWSYWDQAARLGNVDAAQELTRISVFRTRCTRFFTTISIKRAMRLACRTHSLRYLWISV